MLETKISYLKNLVLLTIKEKPCISKRIRTTKTVNDKQLLETIKKIIKYHPYIFKPPTKDSQRPSLSLSTTNQEKDRPMVFSILKYHRLAPV